MLEASTYRQIPWGRGHYHEDQMQKIKEAYNHFFLFQLNAHNMLNTYIYHQIPPSCFSVCYTIFSETMLGGRW
jgi:hypothetical protein